jgi:orotidine-5'-phosphate decarboxylase
MAEDGSTGTTGVETGAPPELKAKLAVALDVDDIVLASRIARELQPWFGVAKVGLELYSAAGPDAIGALLDLGYEVFFDLKLHDIPTTVGKAAQVAGSLGVSYLTLHAHGGMPMLRAGVEGLYDGATKAGLTPPIALAVTVLTSDDTAPPHIMPKRAALAVEAGCGGIVCAASDLEEAARIAPRLERVVPGIRPAGAEAHDQARPATPREALDRGADLLVIGRPVTAVDDGPAAAAAIVADLVG